ncbi:MAG: hypothetical protein H7062_10060, partial [Candidatus Saccharimonas sp.]|nr:hypothetical protein [Planctomycetaceae bacterium]
MRVFVGSLLETPNGKGAKFLLSREKQAGFLQNNVARQRLDRMTTNRRAWLIAGWLLLVAAHAVEGATRLAVVTSGGRSVVGSVASLVEARLTTVEEVEVLDRAEIDRVLAEQRLSLQGGVAAEQAVRAGRLLKCDLLVVIEQTPDLMKPPGRDASRGNDPAAPNGIRQRVPPAKEGSAPKDETRELDVRPTERPDYGSPAAPSAGVSAGPPLDAKPLLSLIVFDAATGLRLWDEALPSDTLDESVAAAVGGVQQAVRKQRRNIAASGSNKKGDPVESLKLLSLVG